MITFPIFSDSRVNAATLYQPHHSPSEVSLAEHDLTLPHVIEEGSALGKGEFLEITIAIQHKKY